MSKILIVAEKSSQCSSYRKALFNDERKESGTFKGNEITITALSGHVLTFKEPKEIVKENPWQLDAIPFKIKDIPYKVNEGNERIVKKLETLFKEKFDFIINATDADREGSYLFYEVYDYLKCKIPVKRFYPTAMTEDFIRDNILSRFEKSDYDRNMGYAGEGRAYLDYQFGNNNTVLFTKKIGDFVKVGRVKLGVLAVLNKREEDIAEFGESKTYFTIDANFDKGESEYVGTIVHEKMYDESEAKAIISDIGKDKNFTIETIKREKKLTAPPLPYTLVSLGKDCYSFFSWNADKTLKVLQTLYESKLATYPRTKIPYLPETDEKSTEYNFDNMKKAFGLSFSYVHQGKRVFDNSKVKEHSGIIPLLSSASLSQVNSLGKDEKSLYLLLVSRFFQVFSKPEEYDSFIITTKNSKYTFKTSIKEVTSEGWTQVRDDILTILGLKGKKKDKDDDSEKKGKNLNLLSVGNIVNISDIRIREGKDNPPPLLNNGTLVEACSSPKAFLSSSEKNESILKFMPEAGIGTVATLGDIIKDMIANNLITVTGDKYTVSSKGKMLWSKMPAEFKTILFTAMMEEKLESIARGEISIKVFKDEMFEKISSDVEKNKGIKAEVRVNSGGNGFQSTESKHDCPNCSKKLLESDKAYSCSCDFTLWKTVSNKKLTGPQIEEILKNGRTKEAVKGLKSKAGKDFSAILVLDKKTGKLQFVF